MQNMLMYLGYIARTNSSTLPFGTAKTAMIYARDAGEVAAVVLFGKGRREGGSINYAYNDGFS